MGAEGPQQGPKGPQPTAGARKEGGRRPPVLSSSIKVDSSSSSSSCCSLFRTRLCRFIKSEIMDGFWSSRCLNDRIDLPDKIGSFLSGATTSMVVKNVTIKTFHHYGAVAPLKSDPILSSRSIRLFRHLELQNLSIISDFRHRSRMAQEYWAAAGGTGVQFY